MLPQYRPPNGQRHPSLHQTKNAAAWPGLTGAINLIVSEGHWAQFSPSEQAVWLALAKHADNGTGICWPGGTLLAKEAGLVVTTVYKAITRLEEQGHVTRLKRGGSKPGQPPETTKYQLSIPAGETTDAPDTGAAVTTGTNGQGDTGTNGSSVIGPMPPASYKSPIESPIKSPSKQEPAAPVEKMLTEMGISEPTRSRLACLDGITCEAIRRCLTITSVREEAPAGVKVNAIKNNLDQAITELIRAEKCRERAGRDAEKAQAARRQREEKWAQAQEAGRPEREAAWNKHKAAKDRQAEVFAKAEDILDAKDDEGIEALRKRLVALAPERDRGKLKDVDIRQQPSHRINAIGLIMVDEGLVQEPKT